MDPLPGGHTRLEGRTWYHHNLWPARYSQFLSDYIVPRIHACVLKHMKRLTEKPGNGQAAVCPDICLDILFAFGILNMREVDGMNRRIAVVEALGHKGIFDFVSHSTKFEVLHTTPKNIAEALSEKVDLIILNLAMPDREGFRILHALREATEHAAIPMIVVTAHEVAEEETKARIRVALDRLLVIEQERVGSLSTPEYQRGAWRSIPIEEVARGMGVPRSTLARIIGISDRNLARWITGETQPKGDRDAKLQKLKYIYYLLTRALKAEAIPRYLREPNPTLRGRTPLMALQGGDFSSIESELQQLIEGVYA